MQAYLLDGIDDALGGPTLSTVRTSHSLTASLCSHCTPSVRAAVETFLDSSICMHADVRERAWLDEVVMEWRGNMEVLLQSM